MQATSRAFALVLLAILASCAAPQSENRQAPEPEITVRGALAFREGLAPPPGSVATVTVTDFVDDSAAPVVTLSIPVENARVMLPFELSAPLSRFEPGRQYVVRAAVSAPRDERRWMTDVAQIIDPAREETDIGVLLMTRSRNNARAPELD